MGKASAFLATSIMLLAALPAVAADVASRHVATIGGVPIRYTAHVEDIAVEGEGGRPGANLVVTSYVRDGVTDPARRPVLFLFNGGPSAAAIGLHTELGPREEDPAAAREAGSPIRFRDNPDSLLDIADLVIFDPAETGYSRIRSERDRGWFYSTAGDADSLAQTVAAWLQRHGRRASPRYLLGESYGSVRSVVAGRLLAQRGLPLDGEILFGDSIFLQETSRRTHNIVSTAVSLPLLAMTAAYHGRADRHGKDIAAFLDEVYAFATTDYLLALSKGYELAPAENARVAARLAAYTGIPAAFYATHGLAISKQDFSRMLLPGKLLDRNDTRIARDAPPPGQTPPAGLPEPSRNIYDAYLRGELGVTAPAERYRYFAPGSFESWNWGNGCNDYLKDAGLCIPTSSYPSVFEDYSWPEDLKAEFARPGFRAMIVAGYYDGLSSIGTHRYLRAQLGFPAARFVLKEYAAGHQTSEDPEARPAVARDIRAFLAR